MIISARYFFMIILGVGCAVWFSNYTQSTEGLIWGFFIPFVLAGILAAMFNSKSSFKKGQQAARQAKGNNGLVFHMDEGIDIMKKTVHLGQIGVIDTDMVTTIENRLGKATIKNPRAIKENEFLPPYSTPDRTYTNAALQTVFGSGLVNDGEMRAIEVSIKPILEKLNA